MTKGELIYHITKMKEIAIAEDLNPVACLLGNNLLAIEPMPAEVGLKRVYVKESKAPDNENAIVLYDDEIMSVQHRLISADTQAYSNKYNLYYSTKPKMRLPREDND